MSLDVNPINKIISAYPRQADLESDLSKMRFIGKTMMGGGGVVAVLGYSITGIPYVGKLLGVVGMIGGIVIGVLGYDLKKSADNLDSYNSSILAKAGDLGQVASTLQKPEQKYIMEIAAKGTMIGSYVFDFLKASK